jgi:drug/metabolite transporter (DMT)-like permease
VAILGEPLTWSTPAGAVIVVAGAALTQARPKAGSRKQTQPQHRD